MSSINMSMTHQLKRKTTQREMSSLTIISIMYELEKQLYMIVIRIIHCIIEVTCDD